MAQKGTKKTGKNGKGVSAADRYDFSYTQNRELSWLQFDNRVLDEAFDTTVPLFERLKFVSIFESNLDEFFMVRVGGLSDLATLKHQPVDNKSNLTPAQQIDRIFAALPPLLDRVSTAFGAIESQLAQHGVVRVAPNALEGEDRTFVEAFFRSYVSPIISPLVVDPRHPFPNLRNGALYIVSSLEGMGEEGLMGLIEIPSSLPRILQIPSQTPSDTYRYILLEDVVMACLDGCFGSYLPQDGAVIRVIRNADIDPDGEGVEEDEDYRQHMKRILKKRLRLQPVCLTVNGELDKASLKLIRHALELPNKAVLPVNYPLDLGFVFSLESHIPQAERAELLFTPFVPQLDPAIDPNRPLRNQVLEGDKLLFYPYESMTPFLDLVHQAANDDECISIRITLYRVAKQSRLCESLISAVENGKEVTVLMELRARFDEANNIEWAERLEEAGCTVIYGSEGFKCHSKICQLTYRRGMAIERITLLGTGNFNEKTAKLYSDFMLMTAHPGIGEDANLFFQNLSLGNLNGDYRYLGVAPAGLKPLIMTGLNREIERARAGEPARVFFKLNSLTDREVIDKISEASRAGVHVEMIIRGISCLLPGVPEKTENVQIRSIVGRFLEHARVYAFGEDADTIYLSSADMMTRNTEHRVEIAYPLLDADVRAAVRGYMDAQLADNVKARRLTSSGTWASIAKTPGEAPFNSQEFLLAQAYKDAENAEEVQRKAAKQSRVANQPKIEKKVAAAFRTVPSQEAAVEDVVPATAAPAAPEVAPQAESAPVAPAAPAPKPAPAAPAPNPVAEPVSATIIEPEPVSEPAATAATHAKSQTALVPRKRGRVVTALALFGMGFKALFGKDPRA